MTYMQSVLDQVVDLYSQKKDASGLTDDGAYFLSLVLLHEDMHAEAITYARQTLAFSAHGLTWSVRVLKHAPLLKK